MVTKVVPEGRRRFSTDGFRTNRFRVLTPCALSCFFRFIFRWRSWRSGDDDSNDKSNGVCVLIACARTRQALTRLVLLLFLFPFLGDPQPRISPSLRRSLRPSSAATVASASASPVSPTPARRQFRKRRKETQSHRTSR